MLSRLLCRKVFGRNDKFFLAVGVRAVAFSRGQRRREPLQPCLLCRVMAAGLRQANHLRG